MELLNDFNTTVEKAFDEIDPRWRGYEGLVICGTHTPENWEEQIAKIKRARETELPTLGICFGYQLMAIEYARNILGFADATSEEFCVPGLPVVLKLSELKVGLHDGESYWHNYEVREDVRESFDRYCRTHEMIFYRGVQYHPEYQSSKYNPHPLLVKFLKVCRT
jgi:CTP synthase